MTASAFRKSCLFLKHKNNFLTEDAIHWISCLWTSLSAVLSFSSVQLLSLLQPCGLQHARPPCPSLTPRAYSNSCHWVSDAIQPSHPLLSPSPSTFNFPQHQCLFNWDRSFHQMAKILEFVSTSVLPMNTQEWFPLGWTGWISLLSKGFSRVFSNTTAQKHQLFSAQLSSQSSSHIQTGKTIALTRQILLAK